MKKLLLLFFVSLACQLSGQDTLPRADTTRLWQVITVDGNEYFGKILDRNSEELRLKTEALGVITIQVKNLKSIKEIRPELVVAGELWSENPQATRYFWAPNGYGLKGGEGYYQNLWVFFNQVSVGITDNASIGFGIVPLFLFGGAPTPVWITPKVSVPVVENKFNLGAGALIGTVLGEDTGGFFGLAYGVSTFGSRDKNFNIGLGYGFAGGEWARTPTINLSAMIRIGRKGYLLTENYYIDAGGTAFGLLSLGGRTVWGNVALDYGGFIPAGDVGTLVVVPWLGITVSFGR